VPALGYRIEDQGAQGKRWVIVPEEREVVLRIGRAFVKCGSLHGVAIDLNKQGVPAPRGGTWRRNSVHVILTRPIYRGYYTHGDLTVLHPELRIWPADLEAEIDRLLARPTRPWGTKTRHLSTRFVRCGECGGCLLSTQAQRGARHYLVCSRKRYHACDGIGARSEKAVDDAIISAVTSIVSDDVWARTKEILRAALEDQCKADQQEAEVDRLRREVQAAERRTRNLTESVAEAETRDERAPLLQALKAETQRVEGLKGALKAAEAALSSEGPESVLEAAEKRVEELRATLARGGPEAAPAVAAILGDDHFRARRLPDGMWELRAQGTLATLFAELSNGGPPPGRPSSLPSREKKTKKV
jgi:site-specific DNA recombinase